MLLGGPFSIFLLKRLGVLIIAEGLACADQEARGPLQSKQKHIYIVFDVVEKRFPIDFMSWVVNGYFFKL